MPNALTYLQLFSIIQSFVFWTWRNVPFVWLPSASPAFTYRNITGFLWLLCTYLIIPSHVRLLLIHVPYNVFQLFIIHRSTFASLAYLICMSEFSLVSMIFYILSLIFHYSFFFVFMHMFQLYARIPLLGFLVCIPSILNKSQTPFQLFSCLLKSFVCTGSCLPLSPSKHSICLPFTNSLFYFSFCISFSLICSKNYCFHQFILTVWSITLDKFSSYCCHLNFSSLVKGWKKD